jgi:hypothetical protein
MFSSVGRASPLHGGGRGFESLNIHHLNNINALHYGGVAKWLNAVDCKSTPSGSAVRICPPPPLTLGCSQVVRQQTLTLSSRWFDPSHPSQLYDPLAQLVEHLTFNQGVWSSNLQWITICPDGGIGRRTGLKILRSKIHTGSIPVPGTI